MRLFLTLINLSADILFNHRFQNVITVNTVEAPIRNFFQILVWAPNSMGGVALLEELGYGRIFRFV